MFVNIVIIVETCVAVALEEDQGDEMTKDVLWGDIFW